MPTVTDPTQLSIPGGNEIDSRYVDRGIAEIEEHINQGHDASLADQFNPANHLDKVSEARAHINTLYEPEPAAVEVGIDQTTTAEYLLHTGNLLRTYREATTNKPADINYTTKPKPGLLSKSLKMLTGSDNVRMPRLHFQSKSSHRTLIQRESEIGGHLFGNIPEEEHWQFFNLDPHTWFWHKEWIDDTKKAHSNTTRYEIHENGIMKVQDGAPYYFIEGHELNNFMAATRLYYDRVSRDVYHRDPATGQPLAVS